MKKLSMFRSSVLVVLFMTAIGVVSCEEPLLQVEFDMGYTAKITVPQSSGLNLPFDLFSQEITSNAESEFAVNDTRKDLLEEVILTKLDLTITSPSSQRFDFITDISVFLNAEGLAEIKIAEANNIPENIGAELSLDVVENDLKEYIKKDKFSLRVSVTTDEFVSDDVKIDAATNFHVKARVIQ